MMLKKVNFFFFIFHSFIFVVSEEESVTPNISPPRERYFLEANYQSLDKADGEEEEEGGADGGSGPLNPISSRLSISSRFLRKQSRL